jgi:Domain of unknown function (DUF5047)
VRPVSTAFLAALRGSHSIDTRVRVVQGHPVGTNPDGTEIDVVSGSVKRDGTAEVRGSLDLETTAAWPASPSAALTPYGPELFVELAVVLGNGTREWVSQGYFRIDEMSQDRVPGGVIQVTGLDRMAGIRDARLVAPIVFSAGASVDLVFESLILEVYPLAEIVFDFSASGTLLPTAHVCEEDRYTFLRDLARSYGKVMYWDYAGRLQVRSPATATSSVWEVNSGAGGVLVQMSRKIGRQGVYNAVVATGEAPGEGDPARAVAYDQNPASPTYWSGNFGKVPRFFTSSFMTTDAQCGQAAAAMLTTAIGLPYNVDLRNVPNYALDPDDPITVTYPGRTEKHILEKIAMSLTASGAMQASTREQTSVQIVVGN